MEEAVGVAKKGAMSFWLACLDAVGYTPLASRRSRNANEKVYNMSETAENIILSDMDRLVESFEYEFGEIDSPEKVALYNEFITRCRGRTTVMVNAIVKSLKENDKVGVLVHNLNQGKQIERLVKEQVPFLKPGRLRILSNITEWRDSLRGHAKFPIFVDNAVTDLMAIEYVTKNVNEFSWR